jgi:hypothetical protein
MAGATSCGCEPAGTSNSRTSSDTGPAGAVDVCGLDDDGDGMGDAAADGGAAEPVEAGADGVPPDPAHATTRIALTASVSVIRVQD